MDYRIPHPTSSGSCEAAAAKSPTDATLLVFTLGARWESRRRQLLPPAQRMVEDDLHQACLDNALAAGRAAELRLEVSSPLELDLPTDVQRRCQSGPDFGSRLGSALEQAFSEPEGGPVVLVGSDVPDLEASHLRLALDALGEDPDRVVLGPSPDGGIYLLAAARPLGSALAQVHWQCRQTLSSLKRALRRQGRRIVQLPALADLDRRADLELWLATARRSGARSLKRRGVWQETARYRLLDKLLQILASLRQAWPSENLTGSSAQDFYGYRLRGPPLPA